LRQAPVEAFTAWRVHPSQRHFPNVIGSSFPAHGRTRDWRRDAAIDVPRGDESAGRSRRRRAPHSTLSEVSTELFAVASALDAAALAAAIPPACRRGVEGAPRARHDGEDVVLEPGPWTPRAPARHLVPSFSALADCSYAFRFEATARVDGAWGPWTATTTIGSADFPETPGDGVLETQVDLWTVHAPVSAVRVRLRLRAVDPHAVLGAPWMMALSVSDGEVAPPSRTKGTRRLEVPAISQVADGAGLGARVCSPTSLAMVLRFLGRPADVATLAADVFHRGLDLYGVWPAAIRAAARRGVLGYLLRFPDWESAAWCLDAGIPVIASVRYEAGELAGAAIPATPGHLLVITGYDGDDVLVNDPAAPDVRGVPRRYPLAQLARIWLHRSGVGYVLFSPPY
jgi:hypothetical protein